MRRRVCLITTFDHAELLSSVRAGRQIDDDVAARLRSAHLRQSLPAAAAPIYRLVTLSSSAAAASGAEIGVAASYLMARARREGPCAFKARRGAGESGEPRALAGDIATTI